jgi:acetoacetate decarboxylase
MKKCSFVLTPEEYKHSLAKGTVLGSGCKMDNVEGVSAAWATNPETIKRILPPPLQMAAPIVIAYISNLDGTNYAPGYNEAGIFVPVIYKGTPGAYFVSCVLDVNGAGTPMGAFLGREADGMPKKIVDKISVTRVGDSVNAYVEMNGVRVIDINMEIGTYNTLDAQAVFGGVKSGAVVPGETYLTKVDLDGAESGGLHFSNARLLLNKMKTSYKEWLPGSAEVTLQPHSNVPWAELVVGKVLGGGYAKYGFGGFSTKEVQKLNTEEVMPYLLVGKYDIELLDKECNKY